jgi:Fe-S oxidoreductase
MNELTNLRKTTGAALCVECGKCTATCPLADFGDISARKIAGQPLEDELRDHGAGVQRCLTCASCEVRCPQGVRFTEYVRGFRELLPPDVYQPCPHGQVLQSAARVMAHHSTPQRDTAWIGPDLKVAEAGETALFVGCLPLFDELFAEDLGLQTMEIARSAIHILNQLGIEPVLVAQERCCGHDLLWGGDRKSFTALAEANLAAFEERGVKHILTVCAECCRTWRLDYPTVASAYRPRVQHVAEFLAERLESGELTFQGNGAAKLTYQDPCRLGRHLGVYDAPRRLLAAVPGATLLEMQRCGSNAQCCGTSGFIHCDAGSRRLQTERLRSAAQTGAQKLLTGCPKCLIHFTCAQAEDRHREGLAPSIEVQDLTVFAASMLRSAKAIPSVSVEPQETRGAR